MADLSITAANVIPAVGASISTGILGDAATQGQAVYRHTDGTWKLAQHDGTAAEAAARAIVLSAGGAGQTVALLTGGDITIGATLIAGMTYVVGAGAGGIAPITDLGVGDYATIIGTASTTAVLNVDIKVSGIARSS